MKNYHETAQHAYTRNLEAIAEKAAILTEWLARQAESQQNVNWGHVGSMTHVSTLLDELLEFACGND